MASVIDSLGSYEASYPTAWALPFADFHSPRHYRLVCRICGATVEDNGYQLACAFCRNKGFLQAAYTDSEPASDPGEPGFFRYRNWLPVRRSLPGAHSTIVYQSARLSRLTGLKRLWIAFSGYWPDQGANLLTGAVTELEAYCALGRLPAENSSVMVVASTGEAAASFARAATQVGTPCLIVLPEVALGALRLAGPLGSWVKTVSVTGGYTEAARLAENISKIPGFFAEGGQRNVARRAGLGTVLLSVFEKIWQMPDYYFQAIGCGTGAIAVHETARQLTGGRGTFPKLYLSQSTPLSSIYDFWKARKRQATRRSEEDSRKQNAAKGISPYAPWDGIYDALAESGGKVVTVSSEQAAFASELFEATEGIDIAPAAAVAFASLLQAVEEKSIPPTSTVVLNVTGGGQQRRLVDCRGVRPTANLSIAADEICLPGSLTKIMALFGTTDRRSISSGIDEIQDHAWLRVKDPKAAHRKEARTRAR